MKKGDGARLEDMKETFYDRYRLAYFILFESYLSYLSLFHLIRILFKLLLNIT